MSNPVKQIYISQGGRCFECARFVPPRSIYKNSHSFRLVCKECYEGSRRGPTFVIYDDIVNLDGYAAQVDTGIASGDVERGKDE